MKNLLTKFNNINIKYKLFIITSSLLIGLALLIYSILYFSLPGFYEKYKYKNFYSSIENLKVHASTTNSEEELLTYIYYLSINENLRIILYNEFGSIIYGKPTPPYTKNESINYNKKNINGYDASVTLKTKNSSNTYIANIVMPLQPIDEAKIVFKCLMPSIIILALFISFIGAYIYSTYITRPLITIINMEREQENKRKQFIATISHELKTPITIISGQLEGMIYNIGKYKDRDTYLKKTYEATTELKELVNEMMEISKAEMIEQTLKITDINLNYLLNQLVKRQLFLIEDKSLKISTSIEENLNIKADKEKITRALNNIINNAIKYSPQNESIKISAYKKNNMTILKILNTGVTIPEKNIKDLFNPFFRVEQSRSRKTGGSGLGLYITSQILKAHNFKYEIKNKDNTVSFEITIQQ